MKLDILAIGVHPDDVELSCSGTLLKEISKGRVVGILDLTAGELGTNGTSESRASESSEAATILGVSVREQAGLADGFFGVQEESIRNVITWIRHFQPEVVLANAPKDRHPDHGRAAQLVKEACFYAGLIKIETQKNGLRQEAWRPKALYHYIQDEHLDPDFVVDISNFIDKKIQAVQAFKTQFFNGDESQITTPISQKNFIDALKGKNAVFGRSIGVDFAEGFICSRIPGVESVFDLV